MVSERFNAWGLPCFHAHRSWRRSMWCDDRSACIRTSRRAAGRERAPAGWMLYSEDLTAERTRRTRSLSCSGVPSMSSLG